MSGNSISCAIDERGDGTMTVIFRGRHRRFVEVEVQAKKMVVTHGKIPSEPGSETVYECRQLRDVMMFRTLFHNALKFFSKGRIGG